MTDWQIVHDSQEDKPAELDTTSSEIYVYQRRNFQRTTQPIGDGAFYECWQYEERKLTRDEYNAIRAELLEAELTNTQLALTELYESILEV